MDTPYHTCHQLQWRIRQLVSGSSDLPAPQIGAFALRQNSSVQENAKMWQD